MADLESLNSHLDFAIDKIGDIKANINKTPSDNLARKVEEFDKGLLDLMASHIFLPPREQEQQKLSLTPQEIVKIMLNREGDDSTGSDNDSLLELLDHAIAAMVALRKKIKEGR